MDWKKLEQRQIIPPWVPNVSGYLASNFDDEYTAAKPELTMPGAPTNMDHTEFNGFTYIVCHFLTAACVDHRCLTEFGVHYQSRETTRSQC